MLFKKYWKNLVDKGSEFYNNSFKKWYEDKDNDIEMYSIHNEGKSVAAKNLLKHYNMLMLKMIHI